MGKGVQGHRRDAAVGVHPHRGGVEEHLGIGMAGEGFIVVLPTAGDGHDLRRPQLPGGGAGGAAGAAGAQDHHLLPGHVHAGPPGQVDEPVDVRVVSSEPPAPVHHRVHRPDSGGAGVDLVAQGHHRLLVGDGHVEPPEVPAAEEVRHRLRRRGQELVVTARQGPVDLGGEAVA